MLVYRIEKERYATVFPSRGSLYSEGRWNRKGMWVVYTSESIALAKLEALANSGSRIPSNCCLCTIEINDQAPVVSITTKDLPSNWQQVPYGKNLTNYIQQIIDSNCYVAAMVPSVQSPKEHNILLLPDHADFDFYVKLVETESESFDFRLK